MGPQAVVVWLKQNCPYQIWLINKNLCLSNCIYRNLIDIDMWVGSVATVCGFPSNCLSISVIQFTFHDTIRHSLLSFQIISLFNYSSYFQTRLPAMALICAFPGEIRNNFWKKRHVYFSQKTESHGICIEIIYSECKSDLKLSKHNKDWI